ncbi:amidohydrolase [Alkalibacterium iburiense]|uniref:Amidohydrolase n=1 Tax=Alkalibacterium iburiense TaxID=290589 RepID=A0ABN0XMT5_9LACT
MIGLKEEWLKDIEARKDQVIEYRRYLHQHPELSFQEYETSQFIYDEMSKLSNVEVTRPTETSVLVKIEGGKPGKTIGLRADIDALPIQEQRDELAFQSTVDGKMHACGHDGHTAILMVATQFLAEHAEEIEGTVYSIFQHAEELPPGGAQEMVATGIFDDFDFIYGHHLFSTMPLGTIDIKSGPNTGNSDLYELTIYGKGGHAAYPNSSVDPIIVGGDILNKMQTIISRKLNPLNASVISNTVFQAGSRDGLNVIPDTAFLGGSVRTNDSKDREIIAEEFERIVKASCDAYGATYDLNYTMGYSAVQNDEKTTEIVKSIAEELFPDQIEELPPSLGGEDFSAFSEIVPSTYIWIGAGNAEKGYDYPHHHPKFALDEDSFLTGVKLFVGVAMNYSSLADN